MTLPQLLGLDRVVIFKLLNDDPEQFNVEHLFAHILNYSEIRLQYECCHKDIVIFDLGGAKLSHLAKTPLSLIHKIQVVIEVSPPNKPNTFKPTIQIVLCQKESVLHKNSRCPHHLRLRHDPHHHKKNPKTETPPTGKWNMNMFEPAQ